MLTMAKSWTGFGKMEKLYLVFMVLISLSKFSGREVIETQILTQFRRCWIISMEIADIESVLCNLADG